MGLERYFYESDILKLKEIDNDYLRARILVNILFMDRFDKSGEPYIYHLLRVSSNMKSDNGKVLGLLHDVVEDIEGITFYDLEYLGFNKDVIDALKLVTKKSIKYKTKEEKLKAYNNEIDNIINSNNLLALELKIADMSDNYSEERLSGLTNEEKQWFTKKYGDNIIKLRKAKELK